MTALDVQPKESAADPAEPWGQQGIVGMVGPALAKISVLCVFVACLLWNRSQSNWDRFEWEPPGRSIELANVMGRIKLTAAPRPSSTNGGAQFDTAMIPSTVRDGWEPGLAKTIGLEVTSEFDSRGQPATVLRIRWRLIVMVLALYPAAFYFRRWRQSRVHDDAVAA